MPTAGGRTGLRKAPGGHHEGDEGHDEDEGHEDEDVVRFLNL